MSDERRRITYDVRYVSDAWVKITRDNREVVDDRKPSSSTFIRLHSKSISSSKHAVASVCSSNGC